MTVAYDEYKSEYKVSFDAVGRIISMEGTEYQLHGNGEYLREMAYKSDYVLWNGVHVPTSMHYVWVDREGIETVYKFKIYNIEFIN